MLNNRDLECQIRTHLFLLNIQIYTAFKQWQKSLREQDYKINMNVIVECYLLNKVNNSERNVLIECLLIQLFYLLIHVEVFNNIRLT